MMHGKKTLAILMALTLGIILAVPSVSDDSDAAASEIVVFESYFESDKTTEINIDSGATESVEVIAWNMTSDYGEGTVLRIKLDRVTLVGEGSSDMEYKITSGQTALLVPDKADPENSFEFVVSVSVSKFASSGSGTLTFDFVIMSGPSDNMATENMSYTIQLNVVANSTPGDSYGKFLGLMNLDLPSYMTAVISLIVYIALAIIMILFVYPRAVIHFGKDSRMANSFVKATRNPLLGLFLTYAVSQVIFINGGNRLVMSVTDMIAGACYVGFGALLLWGVYNALLEYYMSRKRFSDDSLAPLGIALGKIVIAMGALGWILTDLGIDWEFVITGMGVLGIVLGFGAQSTLTQFFSGLSILCTRPFKPGDLIRMDGSLDTLKVLEVGFMVSTFENWANAEIFTMPNDKVVASTIVNVTKGTKAYRVFVYVGIAYGSDVKLAKKLMIEAAREHPRVISDGSFEVPSARLNEFADSALTMRLAAYVDDFEDSFMIAGELREMINDKFNENDIVIAFPQMDIHITDQSPAQ